MKILFLDIVHPFLKKELESRGFEIVEDYHSDLNIILDKIESFQGIVLRSRFTIDRTFLQAAKNLKWIARSGSGLENIDLQAAKDKNIRIYNSPEGNCDAVAEQTIGMLLAFFRHLPQVDIQVRNEIWERAGNRGTELKGKTIAIIGYGNVGRALARKLQGFEMRILVYDPYIVALESYIIQTDWEQIYEEVDILSLHVPLTIETNGLIQKVTIEKFKKPIVLINTARGACVVTKDLLQAINTGKIQGACLDVFDFEEKSFEKLQFSSLFEKLKTSKQVLLSPHIAGWTNESYWKLAKVLLDKICKDWAPNI
jgi:D-3-phosphoglycerate dehydrogenase